MNQINEYLNKMIEKEQSCTIKGLFIWDNLGIVTDLITNTKHKEYFIITLDQKKAFDYISRYSSLVGSHEILT